jgi:dolichol-phosphate mannosyltransferase|tara:strand:- start:75 stop:791 length:717 start_codon:yes stop_codon:yes gene_type:complete
MTNFIIIPCYNEGENINIILKEINECNIDNLVVVIVDDSEVNFEKKINGQKFKTIYLNRNRKSGRGSAILFGMMHILNLGVSIGLIIEMDADMSHNPNELLNNIKYFKKNNLDLLISSRYLSDSKIINWPLKRKILSFSSNKLSKFLLKVPVSDYTNGYRIYSINSAKFIINNCGKIGDGYIMLSEILTVLYYNKFKIDEIPTTFINRVKGDSNVTIKEILLSLLGLYKIWKIKILLN